MLVSKCANSTCFYRNQMSTLGACFRFNFYWYEIYAGVLKLISFPDHILATAAGNGAVVLWNLNKITKQKQGTYFNPLAPKCIQKCTSSNSFSIKEQRNLWNVYVAKLIKCLADTICQVSSELIFEFLKKVEVSDFFSWKQEYKEENKWEQRERNTLKTKKDWTN